MKKLFTHKFNRLVLTLLTLLIGASLGKAQSFSLSTTYPVGDGPNNVAVADVNNDGKRDLICANAGTGFDGNTLTVLTNNGRGIFVSNATYTVGTAPFVVAVDLRGTGRPDLVTVNFQDSTLTVLTNNGTGVFGSNATYSVGNGPFSVVAADINNDGKLDVISANNGINFDGNTLTVLTNNGSGVLGFNATYTVGKLPSVTAADLRGIDRPDLVAVNYGDDTLMVLTNNGSGIFGSNATYNVGDGPWNVVVPDVNLDGKRDLVCASALTNTLTVLTNNGNGTFTYSATLTVGYNPYVATADINGDGFPDLISADYNDSTLTVLTNNGSGGFAASVTNSTPSNPIGVAAADLNNDGRQDLVSVNFSDTSVTVFQQLPVLSMQFTNQNAIISWPSLWDGYVLQSNVTVSAIGWVNVSNPNGTNRLAFPAATGNKFYRLRHP